MSEYYPSQFRSARITSACSGPESACLSSTTWRWASCHPAAEAQRSVLSIVLLKPLRTMFRIPLLFLLLACYEVPLIGAQSVHPQTVLQFYSLLPDKYFEANYEQRMNWMLDPKRGAVVDLERGYLYAPGDGAQSTIYVCLFHKANGSYLVGVKSSHWEDIEYTDMVFYLYKDQRFVDVTKSVLPVAPREELKYEMPRYGTTIKVRNRNGRRLYDLIWTRDRFRLVRR
jgi:hypothetical protein